jgi:hypothetical protein
MARRTVLNKYTIIQRQLPGHASMPVSISLSDGISSLFGSVKRKLSARAHGRVPRTQMRRALLLGLSFNLYRLRQRHFLSRMSTEPSQF